MAPVLEDLDFTGGDGVLAFLNGMGGTPLIELYVMYGEVATLLDKAGVRIARSLVGSARVVANRRWKSAASAPRVTAIPSAPSGIGSLARQRYCW